MDVISTINIKFMHIKYQQHFHSTLGREEGVKKKEYALYGREDAKIMDGPEKILTKL